MFGYVTVNRNDLKIKEFERYRGFYCGLCRSLKKRHGLRGQVLLSYDMTFLVMLLHSLYEDALKTAHCRCAVHPARRHLELMSEFTDYTADMCVLLAYYKFDDDWRDEKKLSGKAGTGLLKKAVRKIREAYPAQDAAVRECIGQLAALEKQGSDEIDRVSGLTGYLLAEIFHVRSDEWTDEIQSVGFYLGKYIYLLDAYVDLEEDRKKGNYNIWNSYSERKDFEALVENTLVMMMSECARYFEHMPLVEDVDILRNILYSGVWVRYHMHKEKLEKKESES